MKVPPLRGILDNSIDLICLVVRSTGLFDNLCELMLLNIRFISLSFLKLNFLTSVTNPTLWMIDLISFSNSNIEFTLKDSKIILNLSSRLKFVLEWA